MEGGSILYSASKGYHCTLHPVGAIELTKIDYSGHTHSKPSNKKNRFQIEKKHMYPELS
jgi:hypothetical protein